MENCNILVYQEDKPICLMEMFHYRCGIVRLKSPGEEVKVSDKEKKFLLKMRNGVNPIFKEKEVT